MFDGFVTIIRHSDTLRSISFWRYPVHIHRLSGEDLLSIELRPPHTWFIAVTKTLCWFIMSRNQSVYIYLSRVLKAGMRVAAYDKLLMFRTIIVLKLYSAYNQVQCNNLAVLSKKDNGQTAMVCRAHRITLFVY